MSGHVEDEVDSDNIAQDPGVAMSSANRPLTCVYAEEGL